MSETDWVKRRGGPYRTPSFRRSEGWKERPIDVRTEAAQQVGTERRGQIQARRSEAWRGSHSPRPAPQPVVLENDGTPEPLIRRRRKKDPGFPSSWYRWRGEKGRAYIEAWNNWSYGLGPRPGSYKEFLNSR